VKQLLNISAIFLVLLTISPMVFGAMSSCGTEDHHCDQESSSEEESSHNCLSLCFCSCCGTAFYIKNKEDQSQSSFFENLDIHSSFFYQPTFSLGALIDIWQPPKI